MCVDAGAVYLSRRSPDSRYDSAERGIHRRSRRIDSVDSAATEYAVCRLSENEIVDQAYKLNGLTEDEVLERRKRGEVHRVGQEASRTYVQIVRDNLIALINIALLGIGITLVALQRYSDAV